MKCDTFAALVGVPEQSEGHQKAEGFAVGDQKVCIKNNHQFKIQIANFLEHQRRRKILD